jgi:hypothetical protein
VGALVGGMLPTPSLPKPNAQQRREIIAKAYCAEKTYRRAYRGERVRAGSLARIADAARALGAPLPPGAS